MPQSEIHREALGRVARIGALYDIRTESFTVSKIFWQRPRKLKRRIFCRHTLRAAVLKTIAVNKVTNRWRNHINKTTKISELRAHNTKSPRGLCNGFTSGIKPSDFCTVLVCRG